MQPIMQYLRDDALQRRHEYRRALDHDIRDHTDAGETHRKDLQGLRDGCFKVRKLAFGIDPGSSHQMKQVGKFPREPEKSQSTRNQGGFARRLAGDRFLQTLRQTLPAGFGDLCQ